MEKIITSIEIVDNKSLWFVNEKTLTLHYLTIVGQTVNLDNIDILKLECFENSSETKMILSLTDFVFSNKNLAEECLSFLKSGEINLAYDINNNLNKRFVKVVHYPIMTPVEVLKENANKPQQYILWLDTQAVINHIDNDRLTVEYEIYNNVSKKIEGFIYSTNILR